MSLPLPNLTDLKCAIAASGASTLGGALAGAAVAALTAHFFPAVAAAISIGKLAGAGASVALPVSIVASYEECQEQSNEAYRRTVALQQQIAYCKTLEEGKAVVATLPGGRSLSMSQADYLNQMPVQHRRDYEDCVSKGHIVPDQPLRLPAPVVAPPGIPLG